MSPTSIRTQTKKQQKLEADRLFGKLVRARGRCEAAGFDDISCSMSLQCAHLIPRRYLSVRWNPSNAACLCGAHHVYMTNFPLAHERFCALFLGEQMYEQLKYDAEFHRGAPDYPAILERLKEMGI